MDVRLRVVDASVGFRTFFDSVSFRLLRDAAKIIQENHYYPFGQNMVGIEEKDQQSTSSQEEQKFQYNAKEKLDEFGLYWTDYGNRNMDLQTGRFTTVDRFAEKYTAMSCYGYAANNPVIFVDINGDSLGFVNTESSLIIRFETIIRNSFSNFINITKTPDGKYITGLEKIKSNAADAYFSENNMDGVHNTAFTILNNHLSQGKFDVSLIDSKSLDHSHVLFGSFETGQIDLDDMVLLGGNVQKLNTRSTVIHELTEQYAKQVLNLTEFDDAHEYAFDKEVKSYYNFIPSRGRTSESGEYRRFHGNVLTNPFRYHMTFDIMPTRNNKIIKKFTGVVYDEK
ncbi:MAG: hypothetical protein EAZ20_16375 [Bacteroidetes bacterium]|nr:MAG: hypothetical protein EAZ20_16375 [Bacteroidota bacterium]